MASKILLAEDEEHLGKMVQFKLERAGYQVIWKQDGLTAWDCIRQERPDLIILDVMMPGLDGFQVLERIRAQASTSATPVLMLTAYAQQSQIEQGIQTGASDYMSKPFKPAELLSRVRRLLKEG